MEKAEGLGKLYSSLSINISAEDKFLKAIEGLIIATVFRYASLGGMYEENISILSDMKQEARLAVIQEFRKRGDQHETNLDTYRGIIKNACLKTVADTKTIRIPAYWLTRLGRKRREKDGAKPINYYRCLSIEGIKEVEGKIQTEAIGQDESTVDSVDTVESFEDGVVLRLVIEDLFMKSGENEKRILTLLGSGFTATEISKILHLKRDLVYYYISKAKKILMEGGVEYKVWEKGSKRGERRGFGTDRVVGTA